MIDRVEAVASWVGLALANRPAGLCVRMCIHNVGLLARGPTDGTGLVLLAPTAPAQPTNTLHRETALRLAEQAGLLLGAADFLRAQEIRDIHAAASRDADDAIPTT